jgi:hypothetical protein
VFSAKQVFCCLLVCWHFSACGYSIPQASSLETNTMPVPVVTDHEALWARLMQEHACKPQPSKGGSRWTVADILTCLQSWADQEGRRPTSSELGHKNLLPSYCSIVTVTGSVRATFQQLGWAYPGYGEGRLGRRQGRRTPNRHCLACDRLFYSPDPIAIRICPTCKETDAWREETGAWMNGGTVSEAWEGVIDFWEVTADGINRPRNRTKTGAKSPQRGRTSAPHLPLVSAGDSA